MFRRQDDGVACHSGRAYDPSEYHLGLHVASLFVVLAVSSLACAFPLLVLRFPRLRIPSSVLFTVRHFGTGVLLATAFVHLLPTAFISLGDPCLSGFWTDDYPAMPGAIALAAIFLIAGIEMTFSPEKRCCAAPIGSSGITTNNTRGEGDEEQRSGSVARQLSDTPTITRPQQGRNESHEHSDEEFDDFKIKLSAEQEYHKAFLQVVLLECGILFHSVFIGMNLSVSAGSEFIILWIAIVFHQLFEGLALGARIAALKWPPNAVKPWVMCLAYGCTTPIGQAIGLGLHSSYSPDSEAGLLLVGIMNAISAGLLIYASLTELLVEDFLSDRSWRTLRGLRRVGACSWVVLGAIGMSLIGAWA